MNTSPLSVLLLHGPNLNMLGVREPHVYGSDTLPELEEELVSHARELDIDLSCLQSNAESVLIETIHGAANFDAILFNPGAYTHYSYALYDALQCIETPCVEVHLSNIKDREAFRAHSVIAPACKAQFYGEGIGSYKKALGWIRNTFCDKGVGAADVSSTQNKAETCLTHTTLKQDKRLLAELKASLDTPINPQGRIERLRDYMCKEGIAAYYIRNIYDIRWICAFDHVFDSESAHALFVSHDSCLLHTDSRYSEACKTAVLRLGEDALIRVDDTPVSHEAWLASCVQSTLSCDEGILACERSLTLKEYDLIKAALQEIGGTQCTLKALDSCIPLMRARKDVREIERMRAAQQITDRAFKHILRFMREGQTEREIKLELESYLHILGADGLAFDSIVATGANGANPHACSGDRVLKLGDAVVMDFGAQLLGYNSDMTRTVFVGSPTAHIKDAWSCLENTQRRARQALRTGVSGREIALRVEEDLSRGGFAQRMGHGLGHGVGLEIHELPYLSMRKEYLLEASEVVTVEPGIYVPGDFGMRLEDYGVITADGFDLFTQTSHDLISI